jgi:phage terminase small subunit
MSRTGRPRKPDALKKFEGTYRKDRAKTDALALPPGVPPAPKGLPKDARKIWDELVADEAWRVVLTRADALPLEMLVKHMALERRFSREAARKPIVQTPFGPKPNPAAAEARKEAQLVDKLAGEFGLNPSNRSGVSAPAGGKPAQPADGTPLVGPGLRIVEGGGG